MSSFTVHGRVRGKSRPRFSVRNGRAFVHPVDADREYQARIAEEYRIQVGKMHEGPVAISVYIFRELPKSRPKRVPSEMDAMKPDADNVLKQVMDALNGVAYEDDRQVVSGRVVKMPRTRTEERIEVRISEVDEKGLWEEYHADALRA